MSNQPYKIHVGIERIALSLVFIIGIPLAVFLFIESNDRASSWSDRVGCLMCPMFCFTGIFVVLFGLSILINWIISGFYAISFTKEYKKKILYKSFFFVAIPLSIAFASLGIQKRFEMNLDYGELVDENKKENFRDFGEIIEP